MNLLIQYPQLKVVQALAKKRKAEVYLVGGFLRDFILGREKLDFDFAISKQAIGFARAFANQIKGAFVLLDEEHGCARVVRKVNGKIYTFDFADYRDKTLKKDLSRRDFTINTLCVDLNTLTEKDLLKDKVLDYQGGFKDLKVKVVRMVSLKAFQEDPLRMLRAFSLRAILGFKIDPKAIAQIKKDKDLIRGVSYERIRDELFKVLETDLAAKVMAEMDKVGLLEKVIPQLRVMFGCKQGGYHHLDVWKHSLEALVQLEGVFKEFENNLDVQNYLNQPMDSGHSRRALIRLGLLMHDIGKPETKKKEKDRFTFHGHEHVGKNITRIIARMLRVSKRERFILEDLVMHHLRPGYLSNFETPSKKAVYRYFRDTKEEAASIALLSLADQRATRGPLTSRIDQKHHEEICKNLILTYFKKANEEPFVPLLRGNDLIKKLKLKPSPIFGKILKLVAEAQELKKILTKEEALLLARKIANA